MADHVQLGEYETTELVQLTPLEREALGRAGVSVAPVYGTRDRYDLRPGSTVGVVRVGRRQFQIAPKIGIRRLLYLLSWSVHDDLWADDLAEFGVDAELLEVVAAAFARHLERALTQGVVRGYRHREERGLTVRGRIDLATQIRREHGRMLPLNIAYDDHTADTDANRLLLAAIHRLRQVRTQHPGTRARLLRALDRLDGVSLVRFDRRRLPRTRTTRLDAHYRPALALARLILSGMSIELDRDRTTSADALLFDMNRVFEDFVVHALREELHLTPSTFPRNDGRLRLDDGGRIRLEPDLSWIEDGRPIFVGDAKYKRVDARGIHNADLYQAHAYATAAGLPSALLVYAKGEREELVHQVVRRGPTLEVVAIDLDRELPGIAAEVQRVATRVRDHAVRGRRHRSAGETGGPFATVGLVS